MDLGLGSAVTKFVAEYGGTRDAGARRGAFTVGVLIAGALAAVWGLGGLLLRGSLLAFAHLPGPWGAEAFTAAGCVAAAAALGVLAIAPSAALTGLHRLDLVNRIAVSAAVVQSGASVVFLALGYGLPGLGLAVLLGAALTLLGSAIRSGERRGGEEGRY